MLEVTRTRAGGLNITRTILMYLCMGAHQSDCPLRAGVVPNHCLPYTTTWNHPVMTLYLSALLSDTANQLCSRVAITLSIEVNSVQRKMPFEPHVTDQLRTQACNPNSSSAGPKIEDRVSQWTGVIMCREECLRLKRNAKLCKPVDKIERVKNVS
eukprot:549822-Amphidinium_carterae.1